MNEKYQFKSQHGIIVGKELLLFSYFQFYVVVGLLNQSKTSALGNKYMTAFFCLLLWVTLWDWDFGLHYCVVSGQARHINLLMTPTTLRVNICP